MFNRRRCESGKIHAASARVVATPAWIHSEVRIDPPGVAVAQRSEHVTETIQTANNGKVNNGVAAERIPSRRIQRINEEFSLGAGDSYGAEKARELDESYRLTECADPADQVVVRAATKRF